MLVEVEEAIPSPAPLNGAEAAPVAEKKGPEPILDTEVGVGCGCWTRDASITRPDHAT